MITQDIRRKFLKYFKDNGHSIISSSPVIPHDDPTLLFNNAGMNQFKDVFLGKSFRDYKRAATSQKCIRAGGKHNDLENVGHTSRHLTFFEMIGNFSFGDYFKKDAIRYAWEVSTEVFGLDPDRIWPTVFREDDEAFELWKKYVPEHRITRFDEKDNFWAMGDTGPCGPCSELLYDRGNAYGSAAKPLEDTSGERFLEFWNLVFMQYNRTSEKLDLLPKPSIDTGAGLERIISLKMEVNTVFETDVLRSLIKQVEKTSHVAYDPNDVKRSPAFRVIADHLRCLAFAIADGSQPSNVDRGYVLRKILRRSVRYGKILGFEEPFLAKILPDLIHTMGSDYPELMKSQHRIAEILTSEEEAFMRTLKRGGNILSQIMDHAKKHGSQINGEDAFKLKDTYGLPLDEILLLAKDSELTVDVSRYNELEEEAKKRSRNAQKATKQEASESIFEEYLKKYGPTTFVGYTEKEVEATVKALVVNGSMAQEMQQGQEGLVILDRSPFYAEMGGQIGDKGTLSTKSTQFQVDDCISPYKGVIAHQGTVLHGSLRVGDTIKATIDAYRRQKIACNHTATHLLHWALHEVLGEHTKQAGSVVEPNRLRFDFSHHKGLTKDELRRIEDLVNDKIRENYAVKWYEIPYEEAQKESNIKQFFGEKYGSKVRVIDIDFSKELCGGTHIALLGDIGLFKIAKEGSIAAGVRRIEAVTGKEAELLLREQEDQLEQIAASLKVQPSKLTERVEKLLEENRNLANELKTYRKKELSNQVDQLGKKIETIHAIPTLIAEVNVPFEDLRSFADELLSKLSSCLMVLAVRNTEKCQFLIKVSDDLVGKGINAQEIVKAISPIVEGSGGGKPNNAQVGGKAPQKIKEAFEAIRSYVKGKG